MAAADVTITSVDVGRRVAVEGYDVLGTLRWSGQHPKSGSQRYGIEFDQPVGKNNGTLQGRVYFVCPTKTGLFCNPSKVSFLDEVTLADVGITLAGVRLLKEEVERYNRSCSETKGRPIEQTCDVATVIIKPATARLPKGRQAYVYLHGGRHRGKPSAFVSHTWQAEALGLLGAIIDHGETAVARGRPPPVYYLDLASVDQHQIDQVSPAPPTVHARI